MTSGLCERSRKAWKRAMLRHTAVEIDLQPSEVSDHAANDCGRRYLSWSRGSPSGGAMCRMLCSLNAIPRACSGIIDRSINHESAESRRTRECYVTEGAPFPQHHAELGAFTRRHSLRDKTAREEARQRILPYVLQEVT